MALHEAGGTEAVVAKEWQPPEPEPLYEKHRKIYPKTVKGRFRTLKTWIGGALLLFYFGAPWLRWPRAAGLPDQMLLVDIEHQRGYAMGIEIWPQEIYYVAGLLVLSCIALFFATTLYGRVWCGITCPQTVFTDLFVAVERLFEGDRGARMRRDSGPWNAGKLLRKGATYATWIALSLATGWTFVLYFMEAHATVNALFSGNIGDGRPVGWLSFGFGMGFSVSTFLFVGFAREQFCIYMCPWPRFQAAMYDEDSLIVSYEAWRGEPRGAAHKGTNFDHRGHCIECKQCVQVCPTGIDIRDGSQLACIGCGLCVDACDNIMTLMSLPTGLITYDSYARQEARAVNTVKPRRYIRPRTVVYAALMTVTAGLMTFALTHRVPTDITVQHERAPLWVTLAGGSIRNGYDFHILNKSDAPSVYSLRVRDLPKATLRATFYGEKEVDAIELPVKADSMGTFRVYVTAPLSVLTGKSTEFEFQLINKASGLVTEHDAQFAGPDRGRP